MVRLKNGVVEPKAIVAVIQRGANFHVELATGKDFIVDADEATILCDLLMMGEAQEPGA